MTPHRHNRLSLALAALLLGTALYARAGEVDDARGSTVSPTLQGDAARPPQARWLRTELYFAIGRWGDADVAEDQARWQKFLDQEVTPRFPDGLTVIEAYGQWLPRDQNTTERLNSRVLIILHENSTDARSRIEQVRSAWKAWSGDDSVLRASQPVEVSF